MILDKQEAFSEAQAVTATAVSTNILDTGADHDAGIGEEVTLVIRVDEAAAAAGAATVNFQIQTAVDAAFSSPITVFDSGAIDKAALTLNSEQVKVKLPAGLKRYVRVNYVVGTGPLTAGKFSAFLVKDPQASKPYASGFSI